MRLSQILRSPEAEPGGVPAASGSAAPSAPASASEVVTITRAEFDDLRSRARATGSRSSDPEAARATEAARAREVEALGQKAGELERAYKAALRDRELATALVGRPLVPGAAAQLIQLWRDDFEVVEEAGSIRAYARDGRGVEQAVLDRLASPEFAHFCLPSSRGGTGTRGQNRSSGPGPAPPSGPRTLGEAALIRWREAETRAAGSGPAPASWGRRRD